MKCESCGKKITPMKSITAREYRKRTGGHIYCIACGVRLCL